MKILKQVTAVLRSAYWSFRRARAQGTGLAQLASAIVRAMKLGPRGFARVIASYAAGGAASADCSAPVPVDVYRSWLQNQERVFPTSAGAGRISVVMPVCDTPEDFLRAAVASVTSQGYKDWELCIHDDGSKLPHIAKVLAELRRKVPNLRISRSEQRSGIAEATNAALAMATGRWVTFLDHDDLLHPEALGSAVAALVDSGANIVYTDHDVLGEDGQRRTPYFKPDWSHDLFLSQMYLGHMVAMDRDLVTAMGGLRADCDGSQDYDLVLRCVAAGAKVAHVPRVLYHWRAHAGSTAANAGSKPYAHDAGRKAIQNHVDTLYPGAVVNDGEHLFCYDVRYPFAERQPLASIIIPTRDGVALLDTCVTTLLEKTDYANYEIIVVDNGSSEQATHDWFSKATRNSRIKVLPADVPFNWSALNNLAAREARGEVLVFLNNDTEIIEGDWLQRLAENALRPDIGVCGPLLLYGDRTIQHAGVVVGMGGWADHVFKGLNPVHCQNLFVSPVMRRNVLAVTGACMVIAADKFHRLGGFDETFIVCGSDVELCLRAHESGLLNLYVAESRMVHHESKTRDPRAIPPGDFVRSAEAYSPYREIGDPFYNVNLDPMQATPNLRMTS